MLMVAVLATTLTTNVLANTQDEQSLRIILTHKTGITTQDITSASKQGRARVSASKYQSLKSDRCLETPSGVEICVPVKAQKSNRSISTASKDNSVVLHDVELVEISAAGVSSQEVVGALKATQWFADVELDVIVKSTGKAVDLNDPLFLEQHYLRKRGVTDASEHIAGSNFANFVGQEETESNRVGVAVLDSAFYWFDEELEYAGGYSYVTAFGKTPNANYLTTEVVDGCIPHGTAVASVIGAKANNSIAMAGAISNVDVHAFAVMDCGVGSLYDVAMTIRAVLGFSSEEYPAYEHEKRAEIKVINMSLGGMVSNGYCPSYFKEVVELANNAGVLLVASAGNFTQDAQGFTPANCGGIISVGAVNEHAELAPFSNYGTSVDFVAQGEEIIGLGSNIGAELWWEGTSFSGPLLSATLAEAQRSNNGKVSTDTMLALARMAATPIEDNSCDGNCGAGIVDTQSLVDLVSAVGQGAGSTITYALSSEDDCTQAWFVGNFNSTLPLCEMLKISLPVKLSSVNHYKIEKTNIEDGRVTTFLSDLSEDVLYLPASDIDTAQFEYKALICNESSCTVGFELDTSKLTSEYKPKTCP